ncbi:MAG: hypothetical protein K0U98_09845 [Deltaproteobacteria bacterium]|nr:hypothetical protein [Deltaproteobacteria bacterium]
MSMNEEEAPIPQLTPPPSRGLRWVLAAALLLWLAVAIPAALGQETFYVRDVFSNNLPQKAFGAEQLRQGRIPTFNPEWALGQPFQGNPAVLPFYPGNILYLVLPFWSAFNLHFVLHWLLALFAMRALARALDQGEAAALLAGITYAGCGFFLSSLSFYNVPVVAAWWPLVMTGAMKGGRRGIALGGAACGMALLGGEPITAALGLLPLMMVLKPKLGWRRSLLTAFSVGAIGLVVALPQIVATARIFEFSFRGGHGNLESVVSFYFLRPERFLELLIPFPFGWPNFRGNLGIWYTEIASWMPFFPSIYFGVVALILMLAAGARRWPWITLAISSLLLAWIGGSLPGLLGQLSLGLFRYPEKFIFWLALAAPLLAGWGLDRLLTHRLRWWNAVALGTSGLTVVLCAVTWLARPRMIHAVQVATQNGAGYSYDPGAIAATQMALLAIYFLLASLLLLGTVRGIRQRRPAMAVACQLAALVQLTPLIQTDSTQPYSAPTPWEQRVGTGASILNTALMVPRWHPTPHYPDAPQGARSVIQRIVAQDLYVTPGVLHGNSYPFAVNVEGLNSSFCTLLEINLKRMSWESRVNWFQVAGLDAVVSVLEPAVEPRLELLEKVDRFGVASHLYRVQDSAPEVWWPQAVGAASNPIEALVSVSEAVDPIGQVVAALPVDHQPGGSVQLLLNEPDRIEIEVESSGGLAVIQRAFQPLFKARLASGERLATTPVNLILTGVAVPAGRHRVILQVSHWPEILAGLLALLALVWSLKVGFLRSP